MELLQCVVEGRRRGESGVASVQLLEGEALWAVRREHHGHAGRTCTVTCSAPEKTDCVYELVVVHKFTYMYI